ncbi:MAG: cardiolipin synthase [Oscillospiraceae bacterium]
MKKVFGFLFHRVVIVVLLMLIQVGYLVSALVLFEQYFAYMYAILIVISALVVLYIIGDKSNPAYKIAWIIPILLFPIFGGLFYLMFGRNKLSKSTVARMESVIAKLEPTFETLEETVSVLENTDKVAALQSRYIAKYSGSPLHTNTYSEYLPTGEEKFAKLLEELEKAEHFIFMEYFIIQEGKMWNTILEILERKAKQGLDVRVIYDDFGCIMTLPGNYYKQLEAKGIKSCAFNKFIPVLSSRLNNRDHRKICVIDGHTGFNGGINLADEYINEIEKHGHWKDSAIMLKGDAVWNLTAMFLAMWDFIRDEEESYEQYRPNVYLKEAVETDGYVQPYSDSPIDDEPVGEMVYMNIINRAQRYVYINTPYLIIDNELSTALCNAAKSGIDVRIVTPHIADKAYVHAVTRANYAVLVEAGVKIYEYTPGFIHAKSFVADDEYGVIGTINMDYRSLYLHFECATWLYKTKSILKMKEDYLETLKVCQQITLKECTEISIFRKSVRALLRVFAPLM